MRPSRLLVLLSICFCWPWLAGCGGGDSPEEPTVAAGDAPPAGASAPSPDTQVQPAGSETAVTSEGASPSTAEQGAGSGAEPQAATEAGSEANPGSGSAAQPEAYMNEGSEPVPVSEDGGQGSSGQGSDAAGYSPETPSSESGDSTPATSSDAGYSSESYSSEGSYGSSGGPGAAPPKPVTLADTAQQMFRQGNDQQAFRYLHGHAVTADAASAKELLDKMGFSPRLGRPVLAIRWGIGIEFNRPPTYSGNVFPIGTVQEMPARPSARAAGGEAGGYTPAGATDGTGAGPAVDPMVQQLTGELGQKVVEQLMLRLNRNDYGQVYKSPAAGSDGAAGAGSAYGAGSSYSSESGYGTAGAYPGAAPAAGGREGTLRSMTPGLAMIGVGPTKELLATARQAGLHAVVVFKVAVALNPRANLVFTDNDIYLYDIVNNKELFRTRKPLKNTEVQRHRAEGEDDGVAKTLVSLFETVDQSWRLGPVPEMDPPKVLDRIRVLLSEKSEDDLLPALVEIRMYHTRGLLQDAHLLIAYQRLLGDELGSQLVAGSEEEKKQIVQGWLNPAPVSEGPRDILHPAGS